MDQENGHNRMISTMHILILVCTIGGSSGTEVYSNDFWLKRDFCSVKNDLAIGRCLNWEQREKGRKKTTWSAVTVSFVKGAPRRSSIDQNIFYSLLFSASNHMILYDIIWFPSHLISVLILIQLGMERRPSLYHNRLCYEPFWAWQIGIRPSCSRIGLKTISFDHSSLPLTFS